MSSTILFAMIDDTESNTVCDCCYYRNADFIQSFSRHSFGTSMLHLNSRSLVKNFDNHPLASIDNWHFPFMATTETWFTEATSLHLFTIASYNLVQKNRQAGRGDRLDCMLKIWLQIRTRSEQLSSKCCCISFCCRAIIASLIQILSLVLLSNSWPVNTWLQ